MPKKRFHAIDLFAGAGGLSLGLELAGINVVGAVEYCPKAVQTYRHNFPTHTTICGDITQVEPKQLEEELLKEQDLSAEDIDLVSGGPPCPGFSNIGRSKILSLVKSGEWDWGDEKAKETRHQFIQDPRNELFLEFVKYVQHFKPRWYIMENVPGMMTSKNENEQIIPVLVKEAFREIGYECKWKILSADDYGVPQSRKRLIFIGWRVEHPEDEFEHPVKSEKQRVYTALEAIDDLPHVGQEGGDYTKWNGQISKKPNPYQRQMRYLEFKSAGRVDPRTNKVPTRTNQSLTCHFGRAVNPRDKAIFPVLQAVEGEKRMTYDKIEPSELVFPQGWLWDEEKQLVINESLGRSYKWYDRKSFKDKLRRIPAHKPSPTLVAHMAVDTYMYIHPDPNTHRTITPREGARIQSFPDNFDFSVVSFTSQYRQIGNAVPPLMGKAIANEIVKNFSN